MNRIRDWTIPALVAGLMLAGLSESRAQKPSPPTVLTIRPTKEPAPALKYRLVPERRELVSGNAAIFYHRACLMIATRAKDPKGDEKTFGWLSGPAKEIPREEARSYVERFRQSLHEAELGAFREDCNWEFDRREEGYAMLLPEIQEIRQVGRMIALKARLEILDGHPDLAFHWIEVGFAMSRHVGETPFLISSLVGDAIAGTLKQPLEDLVQTSGAPNLYWALATRPRPLIDMQRSIEGERYLLERELPELREVDGPAWSNEKARLFGDELFGKLKVFTGDLSWIGSATGKGGAGATRLQDLPSRLALAAMVARVYPEAKRALITRGRTAAEVDAMPTLQVVLIHAHREYQILRDDIFKRSAFPYWQTKGLMDHYWLQRQTVATKVTNPILTMFTSLMPAIQSALQANARIERQFDALQCVEAIRMYAAQHDGALPESLDAMTETPLPVDSFTGKPFEYKKVDDTTAKLSATIPPGVPQHPSYRINYELKLVK